MNASDWLFAGIFGGMMGLALYLLLFVSDDHCYGATLMGCL